jgi:hypothetical protein
MVHDWREKRSLTQYHGKLTRSRKMGFLAI